MRAFVLVVAVLMLLSPRAEAHVRYIDKDGVAHWVQTPEQVPPEYRGKAEQPTLPEVDAGKGEDPAAQARRKAFEDESGRESLRRADESLRHADESLRHADESLRRAARPQLEREWASAVQRCRARARGSVVFDGRAFIYGMSFDAFVSGPGRVEMVGPAHANFAFRKCMTEAGQPVE